MAITAIECTVFLNLLEEGLIPRGADMLELGEQNWYGDLPIEAVLETVLAQEPERLAAARERLDRAAGGEAAPGRAATMTGRAATMKRLYAHARLFYYAVVAPRTYTAIDLHGTEQSMPLDLNDPVDLGRQFGLVTNIGTAEHVFNIHQVFKTVHEHTAPGGLMIHTAPFNGWWDHGFYCLQPTLFFDLAAANGYDSLRLFCASVKPLRLIPLASRADLAKLVRQNAMPAHAVLVAVLRKAAAESGFRPPRQGIYHDQFNEEVAEAWADLRF